MRRLTLSAPALAAVLAVAPAAVAQHHAAVPHVSQPHMQAPHFEAHYYQPPMMQVPHMMQPQFHAMSQIYANAGRSSHANKSTGGAMPALGAKAGHTPGHSHPQTSVHPRANATAHNSASAHPTNTASAHPSNTASAALAPGKTPQNTMNFPSNNVIHFPSNNVINFPQNNVIHFPSEVSVLNTGLPTLNFPSQASIFPFPTVSGAVGGGFHFPSFVTSLGAGAIVPGSSARSSSIPTSMLATPLGVGGMTQGLHNHYFRSGRVPYYGSYRNYTSSNAAQQHMNRLIADLDALQPGFSTTSYHQNRLQGDLMAVSVNYHRPSTTMVHQLARNLAIGMTHRQNPTINTASLAQGLRIVVNGGHLNPTEVNTAIQQSQYLLQEGGFTPAHLKAVVSDMHAVVGQAQLNRGNGFGTIR